MFRLRRGFTLIDIGVMDMDRKKWRELVRLRRRLWWLELEDIRDEIDDIMRVKIRDRELRRPVPGVV